MATIAGRGRGRGTRAPLRASVFEEPLSLLFPPEQLDRQIPLCSRTAPFWSARCLQQRSRMRASERASGSAVLTT
eukprot:9476483-Pyramimonas_sp.AAC.1